MTTCSKCNKGDIRKERTGNYCTNSECSDSFYQKFIVEIPKKVEEIDKNFKDIGL